MDGQALIIEIGKRAKAKERASSGAPVEDEETEGEDGGDVDSIKASAVEDIVSALGLKSDDVDMPALTSALQDFADACAVHAPTKKKDAE